MLRKNLKEFMPRTMLQPLLLVFVFTYVFPKIGQGVGGGGAGAATFSSVARRRRASATAIIFQGIQAVALPLVQEFGYTREIEDRVLAPLPVGLVAFEKIVAGARSASSPRHLLSAPLRVPARSRCTRECCDARRSAGGDQAAIPGRGHRLPRTRRRAGC